MFFNFCVSSNNHNPRSAKPSPLTSFLGAHPRTPRSPKGGLSWVGKMSSFRYRKFNRLNQLSSMVRWPFGQYRLSLSHRRNSPSPAILRYTGSMFDAVSTPATVNHILPTRGTLPQQWDFGKHKTVRIDRKGLPSKVFNFDGSAVTPYGLQVSVDKSYTKLLSMRGRPARNIKYPGSDSLGTNGDTAVRIVLEGWGRSSVEHLATIISWACLKRFGGSWGTNTLPRSSRRWTLIKSPFVNKKSREQFESRSYKRIIEGALPRTWVTLSQAFWDNVARDLPFSGVRIRVFWHSPNCVTSRSGSVDGTVEKSQSAAKNQKNFHAPSMHRNYLVGWSQLGWNFWYLPFTRNMSPESDLYDKLLVLSLQGRRLLALLETSKRKDRVDPKVLNAIRRWSVQWSVLSGSISAV
jgi:ribosomal protein S10